MKRRGTSEAADASMALSMTVEAANQMESGELIKVFLWQPPPPPQEMKLNLSTNDNIGLNRLYAI